MIIKKYQARTEKEAIMLANEELGKDAIVMNIKSISPKGIYKLFRKPIVEITAAIDDNISYKSEKSKTLSQTGHTATAKVKNDDIIDEPVKGNGQEEYTDSFNSAPSAIELKLNNLQNLIEKQMIGKEKDERDKMDTNEAEGNKSLIYIQLIYNQLINSDVDEKYANTILAEIDSSVKKDVTMDNILASIYQKIILKLGQPKLITTEGKTPRFIFFIGPTGVGKTTTIAKIASKFKINEKVKVAFLTADTYRIAAVDQLRTYATILGVPLKVVYTDEEIKQAVDEFTDYDLVFVDTAGRSHRNKDQRDDIEALISAIDEDKREVYLVLSATTKYQDLVKITEAYKDITNYSLIFTKLDETTTIGNIFNIRMLTQAPLSYATYGQNVPDDIEKIDPQSIAKQLLRGQ